MGIVKKLDSAVNFGGNQSKFGQSEWEMMTPDEKNRSVFPLVLTSCSCYKLNEYSGKFRGVAGGGGGGPTKIEVLSAKGDFGGDLSFRKVSRSKQRTQSKMGSSKTAVSEMGEMIQNTLLRLVNTISGCSVGRSNAENCTGLGNSSI